jgi:hypothetical protein
LDADAGEEKDVDAVVEEDAEGAVEAEEKTTLGTQSPNSVVLLRTAKSPPSNKSSFSLCQ